ncbi:MAG: branched-chain amino acid ABC transporter permease [Anaerolineales bacterium]|nr:branched-chain amino acid ABC transporter permease [Anaerolineales bacterium]
MKFLRPISIVLLIIILAYLPMVIEKDKTINLLILIFLYISLASSWNILGGYTGQTSLGHAAFFGLGALATRLLWIKGFPVFPSILAGSLLAVVFALLIGAPAFRLKGVYFAIGTLALAQILNVTVGNVFPAIAALPVEELVAYQLTPRYYLFLGLAVLIVGAAYLLANSRLGLGMMSVREEEDAAESLGVSALRHKLIALGISAFFTGLAGGAFAYYHVSYYFQFPFTPVWSLDMLTMVYIGGTGTILGPVIGAVFFVGLREFLVRNLGEYHLIVFGVLFVLVVLFLPGGIISIWHKIQSALARRSKSNAVKLSPKEES